MFYVRDWGRPCGVEPVIFESKEDAEKPCNDDNPFGPSVEEFKTKEEAERFIKGDADILCVTAELIEKNYSRHKNCNYYGFIDEICNKCGQVVTKENMLPDIF